MKKRNKVTKKDDSRIERLKLYATIVTFLTALVGLIIKLIDLV